jgi:hypothetical protein
MGTLSFGLENEVLHFKRTDQGGNERQRGEGKMVILRKKKDQTENSGNGDNGGQTTLE